MPVLDTSVLIERIKTGASIKDNITEISVLEYPPVLKYEKFTGKIYYLQRRDVELALTIQIDLRKNGKQKSIPDLLISAICINRNEELVTKDRDFLEIAKVSDLKVKLI